jgi:diphosphomevalonate decarboxylase
MALESKDWPKAYRITWREFQDMHALFTTAQPPFSYMSARSEEVLQNVQKFWQKEGDGPLVTMDAGPNIHLLYRPDQIDCANRFKQTYLVGNYDVL